MKKIFWTVVGILAIGFILFNFVLPLFWFALGLLFKVVLVILLLVLAIFAFVKVTFKEKRVE